MMKEIKALVEEKKKMELSPEDKEKLSKIEILTTNEAMFFLLDMKTAYGILQFLGVKDEDLSDYYTRLTSIKNFSKISNVYVLNEERLNPQREKQK